MTEKREHHELRTLSKRYARAHRVPQHQALNLIAGRLGFPSWTRLITAGKNGWTCSAMEMLELEEFIKLAPPSATFLRADPEIASRRARILEQADVGVIGQHAYRIHDFLGDIIVAGDGWSLRVPENPSAVPVVEIYSDTDVPVHDPAFLKAALQLANGWADQVKTQTATDWPRRCTKPDHHGVVRHPLSGEEASVWFCFHCDSKISGYQIADNFWHCPGCEASPLDIYDQAFWCDDGGKSLSPLKLLTDHRASDTEVKIVDGRLKLNLTEEKIEFLIRLALIDDASNISEKQAALLAEIDVDFELGISIALEAGLWPEDKDPVQAFEVAKLVGLEVVDLAVMWSDIPFAWPGLGEVAKDAVTYTQMMLDAYRQNGGVSADKSED